MSSLTVGRALLALVTCSGALSACSGDAADPGVEAAPPAVADLPDVVLVTLDTTRADRIGAYGYANAHTETIDKLANAGLRFSNAYSPLPLTIPAHATLFTGLLPYHHNIRANGDNVLDPSMTTLAEHLHDAGYRTGASVAAFVTTRQWGFNQGFDAYYDTMPEGEEGDKNYWHTERSGDLVVDDALNWLAGQPEDKPVFLWVHLYDAHYPYAPKEPYLTENAGRPYDGELAFVDDQVQRLVDAFASRRVLWALVGDHGESLGEHQELTHGLFNYNATQHVPFILSGQGVDAGVYEKAVSTADLSPTILRTLGLPVPDGLDGKPQPGADDVPYAESYQLADRFKIAPHRMVVDGTLKLIDTPIPELYDLVADPGEKANLAEARPDDVKRLKQLLTDKAASPPTGHTANMDADTQAQLAALGYTSPTMGGVDYDKLPDPKGFREFFEKLRMLDQGNAPHTPEQTLAIVDEAIALKSDAFELRMRRVNLLARMKRVDEARDYIQTLTKDFGDEPRVWATLAAMAVQAGQPEQALEYAQKALTFDPKGTTAQEIEVQALFQLKREEDAVAKATAYCTENTRNYGVSALLGQYWLKKADYKKAEDYLRVAVSGPTPRRAARSQLALLAIAAGARQDAYRLLEPEVKEFPGNLTARRLLSKLYSEDQRWLDQRPQAEAIARAFPKEANAHRQLAQCLFNLGDYAAARKAIDHALALAPDSPDVMLLHANLLAKEGKKDEGYAIYQKANAMNEARVREAAKKGGTIIELDPKTGKPLDPAAGGGPTPAPAPVAPPAQAP